MILREIVHTCSNAHVARAALASIGGEFAKQFAAKASHRNMSAGVLAAAMVKEFSAKAPDEEWEGVDEAVRGADQPILSGLRYILAQGLRNKKDESGASEDDRPAHRTAIRVNEPDLAGRRGRDGDLDLVGPALGRFGLGHQVVVSRDASLALALTGPW